MRRNISLLITFVLCVQCLSGAPARADQDNVSALQTAESVTDSVDFNRYSQYFENFNNVPLPLEPVTIDVQDYMPESIGVVNESDLFGKHDIIRTESESKAIWRFSVPEDGLYSIEVDYLPLDGKSSAIERELETNGIVPFVEASGITFFRLWENAGPASVDSDGNEFRPDQVEKREWTTTFIYDNQGFLSEPLKFYFNKGENTLSLTGVNEPMAISQIRLVNPEPLPPYKEVLASYTNQGYKDAPLKAGISIQGENAAIKTDPSLYAVNDKSSPLTVPTALDCILLNTIGGYSWSSPRQKLTWSFHADKAGLYTLSFRCKQNFVDQPYANRAFYLDGKIPFEEAKNIEITYDTAWQMVTFGGDDPYKIYLSEGPHTISLENTSGYLAEVAGEAQTAVSRLNDIRRKLRMVVGQFPDSNRDYAIEKQIPECEQVLKEQSEALKRAAAKMSEKLGEKSASYSLFQKLFVQLDDFARDISSIPTRLDTFENNIAGISDFIIDSVQQPLLLDYILLNPPAEQLPKANESFFEKVIYEIKMFFYSFFVDYNRLGVTEDTGRSVSLWLTQGRDQGLVMKNLIDSSFTKQSGIRVEMRIVLPDVVLPAVAGGKGPDIALGQEKTIPVNYGLRSALYDLGEFSDLDDILTRFDESAVVPMQINGHTYGLPEIQTFNLVYYRKDILKELGLSVPDTWDDLYNVLYTLHKNYLDVGMPNLGEENIDSFMTFLHQQGGDLFNHEGSSTMLDNEEGMEAFKQWINLYTKHKVSQKINAYTRFCTGEAPIVIQPLLFYGWLSSSAADIRGLWEVAPIPGTVKPDGTIDRSGYSSGTAAVIFKNTAAPDDSWEFLKWWTDTDAQVNFSREMEILQGPAGRVLTANVEAFSKLSWPNKAVKVMEEARSHLKPVPEVPGNYVVVRYLCTAARYAVNTGGDPSEILHIWNKKINQEITAKREEFHMN